MSKRKLTAADVAEYILDKIGPTTAMKLQKLVYYCQAWSLVWDDAPLFDDPIEAWINGPVVRSLYDQHRGEYRVSKGFFTKRPKAPTKAQRETMDLIICDYGPLSSGELSTLTHRERPWRDARSGLSDDERGARPIPHAAMAEFYESLLGNDR